MVGKKGLVPLLCQYGLFDEYSGENYTACPVNGNRHSVLVETTVPEAETV